MTRPPILIRRLTPADAPAMARIMAEPEVQANLMQLPYPSEERWKKILEGNDEAGRTDLALGAVRDGELVGSAGLHPVHPALRRRHAMVLGISVAVAHQGTGVGSALMQALCDYADQWGQVLRLELTVFADNTRAINLYRRFGFAQEGLHRGYALRAGQYDDVISMARLHPNPPQIGG